MKAITGIIRNIVTYPYPNRAIRVIAILALDLAMFAAFYGVVSLGAVALHAFRPIITLAACVVLWLVADGVACASRRR